MARFAHMACLLSLLATIAGCGSTEGGPYSREGTRALGDAGGKIAILDHKPAESCLLRVKGFKEVVEAYNA